MYGLTSQLRKAVSISANIVKGYGKRTAPDKRRFLNISQGSLEECRYYLIPARDLNFNSDFEPDKLPEEVSRLLNSYSRASSKSLLQ